MSSRPLVSTLLAALLLAPAVPAQIFRRHTSGDPRAWISAGIGYLNPGAINDGSSGSRWDFGSAAQWRASVELQLSDAYSLGVTGTYANMPLRYESFSALGPDTDAHVAMWSALGTFHVGGGRGFHQIIEVTGGVVGYDRFRADGSGERLPPAGGDRDFIIGAGYGFGFALNPRAQIALVQDVSYVLHQRTGLAGNQSAGSEQTTLRASFRLGVGTRRRRF